LIIVADGALNQVNFETFIKELPETEQINWVDFRGYLIYDYQVCYAFSASTMLEGKSKKQIPSVNYLGVAPEMNSDFPIDETRFGKFSVMLTILAIVIASLGLIGLTAYMAEQRTKEIGIRRVMGASIYNTITLLSSEFIRLILISNLIAWPVTYLVSNSWLQNFHQRIAINWMLFLLAE
jgi:ABC-type antimicrobial peptide transport system permease subunit